MENFFEKSQVYKLFLEEKEEIQRHKWVLSERKGCDVGYDAALFSFRKKPRGKLRQSSSIWNFSFSNWNYYFPIIQNKSSRKYFGLKGSDLFGRKVRDAQYLLSNQFFFLVEFFLLSIAARTLYAILLMMYLQINPLKQCNLSLCIL